MPRLHMRWRGRDLSMGAL
ncbi:hypothetical protein ID866_1075 [Astraeus odoratus]|nr:hypothetical protein ID866_1075 [Astraeus odoratus]